MSKFKKHKINLWRGIHPLYKDAAGIETYHARKNDYMNLILFDNHDDMYEYVNKYEKLTEPEYDYNGRCFACDWLLENIETKEIKVSNFCGNIYLVPDTASVEVIAHESFHAILGYFIRKIPHANKLIYNPYAKTKPKPGAELEELFAYMIGSLSSEIAERCVAYRKKKNNHNKNA